eukprot:TRINITY_DN29285_c0_g1_i1.p1 TRINITY_DN29285_c0_g1~~TRINITY_DN29285_c0_g1_i1.p1  ORF type:complete len:506 (-),score=75.50 TRINITY_DN29285_c0_g1_i1:15-1532(-)
MNYILFKTSAIFSYDKENIILILILIVLILKVLDLLLNRKKQLYHIPGPLPLPLVGNALLFANAHENFLPTMKSLGERYGKSFRLHLGSRPNLVVSSPTAYEKILSSSRQIKKGFDYQFLWPWLGKGLLTSTGAKWHARRKLLTQAFHFQILEDFLDIMNNHAAILCQKIERDSEGVEMDIFPVVAFCALDIICETAMGCSLGAQKDTESEYVRAVTESTDIIYQRVMSPWLWNDYLFWSSPPGFRLRRCLNVLHGFTNKVINEKTENSDNDSFRENKKMAFLDLLIAASKGNKSLSTDDIREEVDTFMFEGHDTVATNMSFCLYLLATHPEAQKKCQNELDTIFGSSHRPATSEDLVKMKYLESCVKEALRMFPSIPVMSRTTTEEVEIDGYAVPAHTNIIMLNYLIHRDKSQFEQPDKFDPERFQHDNIHNRHNYAYVPFSAGPRNCIGQKFAMMEEKTVISHILRNFNLQSNLLMEDIPLMAELVLRPKNGLFLTLTKRNKK